MKRDKHERSRGDATGSLQSVGGGIENPAPLGPGQIMLYIQLWKSSRSSRKSCVFPGLLFPHLSFGRAVKQGKCLGRCAWGLELQLWPQERLSSPWLSHLHMAAPLSGLNEPRPLHSLSLGPGLELTLQAFVCQCSGSESEALMLQEEHRAAGTKV